MVPIIDGAVHHFVCSGVYNGMSLLADEETGSYWDHITGECIHGELKGESLQIIPVEHLTVRQALKKWPDLSVAFGNASWLSRNVLQPVMNMFGRFGIYPPHFHLTFRHKDERLPDMTSGLGVSTKKVKRFYPVKVIQEAGGEIRDRLSGRPVLVSIDPEGYPTARYTDREEKPMQLYCRWYGFVGSHPGCEIYELPTSDSKSVS